MRTSRHRLSETCGKIKTTRVIFNYQFTIFVQHPIYHFSNKIMRKVLYFVILAVTLAFGGVFLWWNNSISPVSPSDTSQKIFVVAQGESIRSIGNELSQAGLIKNSFAF